MWGQLEGVMDASQTTQDRQHRSEKLDRTFAAQHLLAHKDQIMETWEAELRRQIPEASGKSSLVLSNTLPIFLDELVKSLRQENAVQGMVAISGMSKVHGAERALLSGYFIPQLLLEFSILRQVINQELFEFETLSFEVPLTIDKVIDSAISLATTEFARVQAEGTKDALAKAEASNRDLEMFAAVAAHDLKSPLATVIGFLELLNDHLELEQGSKDAQSIVIMSAALKRMNSLIDRLLEFARIGNHNISFQRVRMSETMAAAIQNIGEYIDKSGAKIQFGSLPTVVGDGQLLTQVFQNLLVNAIKFHGERAPEIDVSVESQRDFWIFKIKDNGIGFDPEFKDQIFGLYKRLDSGSQTSGAGIGLATCRKVVELHRGKIWAESEPGKGSTFCFTLPKLRQDERAH